MRELKRYKEELVALLLLSLVLLAVRWLGLHYWSAGPEDAPNLYDLRSETETVSWTVLRMVIYSLFAWLGLRVTMPAAYAWMKDQFEFHKLTGEQKVQMVFRLFAIMFFGLVLLHASGAPASTRECVVASASADVGVRELTGRNDGPAVERYQRHVQAPPSSSWCAAFVSYHLSACGVANPRSAWSPAFALAKDRVWTPRKALRDPLPADVFTLYYPHLGRVGHAGLVAGRDGRYIRTLEGNTSGGGSRDGDGVYPRRRELSKVYAITNYIYDDAHRSALAKHAGHNRLQAQAHAATHTGAARQRGGALCAPRYHGMVRARLGAGDHQHRCAAHRDQAQGPRHQHAAGGWRPGHGHLRVRQCGHQAAPVGQVDQADHLAQAGGAAHRDSGAHPAVGLVVAGAEHRAGAGRPVPHRRAHRAPVDPAVTTC
jgi:hypothetical protein